MPFLRWFPAVFAALVWVSACGAEDADPQGADASLPSHADAGTGADGGFADAGVAGADGATGDGPRLFFVPSPVSEGQDYAVNGCGFVTGETVHLIENDVHWGDGNPGGDGCFANAGTAPGQTGNLHYHAVQYVDPERQADGDLEVVP